MFILDSMLIGGLSWLFGQSVETLGLLLKWTASALDASACLAIAWAGQRVWSGRTGAWAAVAWHRARFPRSKLEEERGALTIKALRAVGRSAEASVEAARFAARYPRSVFLPSLTDAGAIP